MPRFVGRVRTPSGHSTWCAALLPLYRSVARRQPTSWPRADLTDRRLNSVLRVGQ
jgi:hypothetical protein